MVNASTSENSSTSNCVRTETVVSKLKQLPDGWGGEMTKKPSLEAMARLKKLLLVLERSHMPWPSITAVGNGGFMLTWISMTRDVMVTVDPVGDMQYATALKKLDPETFEIIERYDTEGVVTDAVTIDQMLAWYSTDKAHAV